MAAQSGRVKRLAKLVDQLAARVTALEEDDQRNATAAEASVTPATPAKPASGRKSSIR